ncbi:MAG TPA: leucyl aminopeptidase family protein [Acidiferrobacteraceae bacterium]|nr:leucyl aminopeptidase family protein [Acidiferrobacteraceae bacterium]
MIVFLLIQVKAITFGMDPGYNALKAPRITYEARGFSEESLRLETSTVLLVHKGAELADLPYGSLIRTRMRRHHCTPESTDPLVLELPNETGTKVALGFLGSSPDTFSILTLARKLVQVHAGASRLSLAAYGFSPATTRRVLEGLVAAVLAARAQLPDFRQARVARPALLQLRIAGADIRTALPRLLAEARGNHLARYLTALPPNRLTPGTYRRQVQQIARSHGWTMRFFDTKALTALKAGAFLAVTQGSADPDAGIVKLSYRPKRARGPLISLVGKGICFDTGGTNLKSARHMFGMHEDMEGSAVALGTLLALSELNVPFPVDAWLALAQNDIGPRAYRQNDVVRALDGSTIEVVHTDAEGRMVLADTLTLAARTRPALIMDYATLTGACVYALGTRYTGAVTNRPALIPTLMATGQACGERVWPFPADGDYGDELKSEIADIKQCTLEGEADQILAALFLRRFVGEKVDWIHLDLSAGKHKGGLAHIPTDITGFGVRFSLALLLDGHYQPAAHP